LRRPGAASDAQRLGKASGGAEAIDGGGSAAGSGKRGGRVAGDGAAIPTPGKYRILSELDLVLIVVAQKNLEASVMTPEPRWCPLPTRVKRWYRTCPE